jgi:methionyl-tRNA synthetase
MSKSIGNVVDPINLIDDYGVDPVRYYLMREMVLGQDANFTIELFKSRYNSDLANDFGNLLSRVTTLINKNFSGKIPNPGDLDTSEINIKNDSISLCLSFDELMKNMRLNEAIELVIRFISGVNKYMEQNAPWKLVKEDKRAAGKVLYTAGEALRISALLLSPVMPNRTKTLLDILDAFDSNQKWGGLKPGTQLNDHAPLFPRIK